MSTENAPDAAHRTTAPGIPAQGPPPPLPVGPASSLAPGPSAPGTVQSGGGSRTDDAWSGAAAPGEPWASPAPTWSSATPSAQWSGAATPDGAAWSGGGMPAAVKPGGAVPGVATAGYPASIGDRLLARIIDGGVIIAGFFVFGGFGSVLTDSAPTLAVVPSLIAFAIYFGYEFVAIGLFGQTLGNRVMKLHVVAVNGGSAGWGASAGRVYIPMVASFVTCGLGSMLFYLSPLFDGGPWRRGWYDQLASTVVISMKQPWPGGPQR